MSDSPQQAGYTVLNDRYSIQSLLGDGGMASVYRAHDKFLGREVAVKLFLANTETEDDEIRRKAELTVLAGLSHHGIVTLLDAGVHEDSKGLRHHYLVMELVEGADLQVHLTKGPLSARHIAEIGYDIAEALDYVHARGVVHRDIKPSNILVVDYQDDAPRAHARLTDFGIALFGDSPRLTADNVTTGTAAYLSPEQARSAVTDPASDVYSLGLVLLECFTGRIEFPGRQVESALARLNRDPVIPADLAPHWLELLTAMTARDPAHRPVARELVQLLRHNVIAEGSRHKLESEEELRVAEVSRLAAVRRYDILDTPPDGAFDRITAIAARTFNAPVAMVSIVDDNRIWFKSHHGIELDQITKDPGLCASAILQGEPWIIEDARTDPRALANPLVAGAFGLQFYVGVPLTTADGFSLGTLCVLDFEPRSVGGDELATLKDLAAMVMVEMELRLDLRRAAGALDVV